jgi:hypothetical protein
MQHLMCYRHKTKKQLPYFNFRHTLQMLQHLVTLITVHMFKTIRLISIAPYKVVNSPRCNRSVWEFEQKNDVGVTEQTFLLCCVSFKNNEPSGVLCLLIDLTTMIYQLQRLHCIVHTTVVYWRSPVAILFEGRPF